MSANPQFKDDAISIWQTGVEAVDSGRLVNKNVSTSGSLLHICGHEILLDTVNRIVVVGAGKAGVGMAIAFEQALGDKIVAEKVSGWVNVPEDCIPDTTDLRPRKIHLCPARPAGVNEPTEEGVAGSLEILKRVSQLGPNDLCVVLISGGGSALMPAPVEGITLNDKQQVTRFLMKAGAAIDELNCVRKQLSRIKGGGLARATRAGHVLTLIISDVIDDPLDVIASGPTVEDSAPPGEALSILEKYSQNDADIPSAVRDTLTAKIRASIHEEPLAETVHNFVIGNNSVCLNAAADRARALGYHVHSLGSDNRGEAKQVGKALADLCRSVRDSDHPISAPACILSGGEPIVHVVSTDQPQKGGRNQELVLAGLEQLWDDGMESIVILSGGTDGEDGPTDAAGAYADSEIVKTAHDQNLIPADFLAVNNSYPFFQQIAGLLITGPTHTNVMDLRVCLVN